jgi:glycine/D-amino acid oxidase-like deaminating enzyme
MKNIAIVGAGFSGLATAWYLLENPAIAVTLIDQVGIGGGASAVASGLLHPYVAKKLTFAWQGLLGFSETLNLIEAVAPYSQKPIILQKGLLRPHILSNNENEPLPPRAEYWPGYICQKKVPALLALPGFFLSQAVVVDSPTYLQALWRGCQHKGAHLEIANIESLEELAHFDQVILATGWNMAAIRGITTPPITQVKGQILLLSWKDKPLPFALQSHAYITNAYTEGALSAGATFERNFKSKEVNREVAENYIRTPIQRFSPLLGELPILEVHAHIRAMTATHRPFATFVDSKTACIGGMGAKGLLYHALLAKQLVQHLLAN